MALVTVVCRKQGFGGSFLETFSSSKGRKIQAVEVSDGLWSVRAVTSKQIMKGFWVVLERLGDRRVSWSGTNLSGL